ncbi:hypothetical protein P4O66_015301 [Electrophorus voltai]|uniref:Phostensin/Taperin PP1-binding domain-containing protein n=1 Tax=Electrophorus voltai TaxID=2609070 RepID=A0AAD8YXZ3_9TELE|nr:hypothetical protein P4O66_015301 [Electrophorus voltai]
MSRIYNLKAVVPRTGVCIGDRSSDVPAHSRKFCPEGRFSSGSQTLPIPQEPANQQSDRRVRDGQPAVNTETAGLQSVQRQVEQLQLREQEVGGSSHSDRNPRHGPQKENRRKTTETQKVADTQTEMHKAQTLCPSQHTDLWLQLKTPQTRSFTINARGSPLLENTAKPQEQDIKSSPSPTSSVSPSPTFSPTASLSSPLFSIRSASGGRGKRGTTITINPKRLAAGTSAPARPSGVTPQTPAPAPKAVGDGCKKRYPTVEEIEVIGGYQNLENSCLVKHRGSPKAMRVCFDDSQLEHVCEYPSEASVLASLPGVCEEYVRVEPESDEEEEGRTFPAHGSKSLGAGIGTARVIRVDESCRR